MAYIINYNKYLERILKIFSYILVIMVPVGILIMLNGFKEWNLQWTTNIFLGIQVILTIVFLSKFIRTKKIILITLLIFFLSFLIELIGIKTGFPFGNYSYSDILLPKVFGISIAIIFAWFVLSVNSYIITRFYLDGSSLKAALVSALIILSIDLILEPFASLINKYWLWEGNNIPIQNYITWFVLGLFFSLLLEKTAGSELMKSLNKISVKIPLLILGVNIIIFSIVNLFFGFFANTILSLTIISLVLLFSFRSLLYET